MMELHAVKLATGLMDDKYGKIYFYLFSKSEGERIYGLHKTVPFITVGEVGFEFNKKALRNKRLNGVGLSLVFGVCMLFMSYVYGSISGINFGWFFQTMLVIVVGMSFYWWAKILPDDTQVKNTIKLLEKTNVKEFKKHNSLSVVSPNETGGSVNNS